MVLVSKVTDTVAVPDEPGATFTLRALSGDELEEAHDRKLTRTVRNAASVGVSIDTLPRKKKAVKRKAVKKKEEEEGQEPPADAPAPDLLPAFDATTVVRKGLTSWSGGHYAGEDCNAENKAMLDGGTRDWAARRILEMTIRPPASAPASETS